MDGHGRAAGQGGQPRLKITAKTRACPPPDDAEPSGDGPRRRRRKGGPLLGRQLRPPGPLKPLRLVPPACRQRDIEAQFAEQYRV